MRHLAFAITAAALALTTACDRPEDIPASVATEVTPEPGEPAPVFDTAALGIPSDADSIADGRDIAITHCASCHGMDGAASPRPEAPELRYVLSYYPAQSLAEDFRAGIHVGHEDMPDFVFGDLGMDVLLSYLVSIQEAPPS